jgi:hypothetical protein
MDLHQIVVVGRRATFWWRLGWDGVGLESFLGLGSNFEYREPENRFRWPRSPPEEQFFDPLGCDSDHFMRTLSVP